MHLKNEVSYVKLAAIMAAAGAIGAAGLSLRVPQPYVSTAVMRIAARDDPAQPPGEAGRANRLKSRFSDMRAQLLSFPNLLETIMDLGLYSEERRRMPVEAVVQRMRRDLGVRTVKPVAGRGANVMVELSFTYPEFEKAQAVVRRLAEQSVERSEDFRRIRESLWQAWVQELAAQNIDGTALHEPPPPIDRVEVVEPASAPSPAGGPRLPTFMLWGFGGGLLAGCATALAIGRPRLSLELAAFALSGCALATSVGFLIPARYTSTAVMSVGPPLDPKRWSRGPAPLTLAERFELTREHVLSRASLENIILHPQLNLYEAQRRKKPLNEVIANMRDRDIEIAMLPPPRADAFRVSFSYGDPLKATPVVRKLEMEMINGSVSIDEGRALNTSPEFRLMTKFKIGEHFTVLEPASFPERPPYLNRAVIAGAGLAGGLVVGILAICLRRRAAVDVLRAPSAG